MSEIKDFNSWVKVMMELPEKKRQEWVERIHDTLKIQAKKENSNTKKEINYLSKALQDKNDFDLVGFSANVTYVKDKKSANDPGDLDSVYIHAWGTPKLLYASKKLPILIIIGADLRVDESVLDEGSNKYKNNRHDIKGITG